MTATLSLLPSGSDPADLDADLVQDLASLVNEIVTQVGLASNVSVTGFDTVAGTVDLEFTDTTATFSFDAQAFLDALVEASETFDVTLTNIVASAGVAMDTSNQSVTTTIQDSTAAVTILLSQDNAVIVEGDGTDDTNVYTVSLTGGSFTVGQTVTATLSLLPSGSDPADLDADLVESLADLINEINTNATNASNVSVTGFDTVAGTVDLLFTDTTASFTFDAQACWTIWTSRPRPSM